MNAAIGGRDQTRAICSLIRLAGHCATIDELLTGRENLELGGMTAALAQAHTGHVMIEVSNYSGPR